MPIDISEMLLAGGLVGLYLGPPKFRVLVNTIPTRTLQGGRLCLPHYYTRAQNVCQGWPVYEVKQPQEKWACDSHDDAPPLSFQLQVAEVIF